MPKDKNKNDITIKPESPIRNPKTLEDHMGNEGYFGIGKRLLTTREAARYLGVKVQTLYNWRHVRKGPDYVMVGAAPRYETVALERFIDANRVKLSA